jgi:hypothetical protein
LRILKTPQIAMRVGGTSSIERTLKLEQTRLKLRGIAKPNWKNENRRLCVRQKPRPSLRHTLRNELFSIDHV